ncbi:hypothetical protein [uncultured Ramlibacter sp.]|uniref:hypothetical protein n=1 Tax=uncultured Ramlibacter sp. TaxID=260755 RepID=UPI002622CA97|nr:hypothetical protein [uncultured Ramlibacter sp.]
MRVTQPNLRSSLFQLLTGQPGPPAKEEVDDLTEDIRQAMLDSLGRAGAAHFPGIARRIHGALDADTLWYLRSGLMAALCAISGERTARADMARISLMFRRLPGNLSSRPSPLSP